MACKLIALRRCQLEQNRECTHRYRIGRRPRNGLPVGDLYPRLEFVPDSSMVTSRT